MLCGVAFNGLCSFFPPMNILCFNPHITLASESAGGFALHPLSAAPASSPKTSRARCISCHHAHSDRHASMFRSTEDGAMSNELANLLRREEYLARLSLRALHFQPDFADSETMRYVCAVQHQIHRLPFLERDDAGFEGKLFCGYLNAARCRRGCQCLRRRSTSS